MINFITKYNLLNPALNVFRSGRSTADAMYNVVNFITEQFDCDNDILGICINVSKAFDSLSHKILLDKLYAFDFRGIAYKWLKSYLNDRYQFVQIGKDKSTLKQIISGVMQRSILGPLMFLVYINDLPLISHDSRFILFADDTTCLTPCLRNTDIQTLINNESSLIVNWLASNHLALNVSKCKYTFFTLKSNVVNVPFVIFNNLHIERV